MSVFRIVVQIPGRDGDITRIRIQIYVQYIASA